MTGKSVTFRTTYAGASPRPKPSFPDSRPNTTPPRRTGFPANTNRPPVSPPKPGLRTTGQQSMGGTSGGSLTFKGTQRASRGNVGIKSAAAILGGMYIGDKLADAIWDHFMEGMAAAPTVTGHTFENGKSYVQPGRFNVQPLPNAYYSDLNGIQNKVAIEPKSGAQPTHFYYGPPLTAVGSFSYRMPYKITLNPGDAPPTLREMLWQEASPLVRLAPAPQPIVYGEPEYVPVPNPAPRPGVSAIPTGVDIGPDNVPVSVNNPVNRPPSGTSETKYSGPAVSILTFVARAMGEGVEWIEVFSDAMGFAEDRHKYFDEPLTASTEFGRRVEFLANGYGEFDIELFWEALAKKVAEDVIAGSVFRRAQKGAQELGLSTYYSLTGPLS